MTMNRLTLILVILLTLTGAALAQWQVMTPRETEQVPASGTSITYSLVSLPSSMNYHVHSTGTVVYQSSGDIADACYFLASLFPISPGLGGKLGAKIRSSSTLEDWFFNDATNKAYSGSHDYDASVASTGSPLTIRFFDTADPPSSYYSDNSGALTIEVAQETPELAIQYDTIYFNNVQLGKGALK